MNFIKYYYYFICGVITELAFFPHVFFRWKTEADIVQNDNMPLFEQYTQRNFKQNVHVFAICFSEQHKWTLYSFIIFLFLVWLLH